MVFSCDFFKVEKSLEVQDVLGSMNWEISVDECRLRRADVQALLK